MAGWAIPDRLIPLILSDMLRYNLAIRNRNEPEAEQDRVCEAVKIDDFRDKLLESCDMMFGDKVPQLSGGRTHM